MRLQHKPWLVCSIFLLAAGCDTPPEPAERIGFGDQDSGAPTSSDEDPATVDDSDAAAEEDAETPPAPRPSYAVLASDYMSTSISLLDQFGELLAEDYVNSGFKQAGLTAALSGDVTLPTRSGDRGMLVIVDRKDADVITRLDLSDGSIAGQVRTHRAPPAGSTSRYASNPYDYVYIDEHTAWATRYQPNLDTGIPAVDRGNDLVLIDPSTMTLGDQHVDLSVFDTTATRTNPDTQAEEEVPVYARPARMVRLGNTLVVGMARMSFDFTVAASGVIALVDLDDGHVDSVALDGLESCETVVPVPGASDRAIVSCNGHWNGDQRGTSGLVELRVTDGTAEIVNSFRPGADARLSAAVNYPIALGGTLVGAVENAEVDIFSIVDLATGEAREVFRTEAPYTLGTGSFDVAQQLLIVPDASLDAKGRPSAGLRRFSLDGEAVRELDTLAVAPKLALPVRSVKPL